MTFWKQNSWKDGRQQNINRQVDEKNRSFPNEIASERIYLKSIGNYYSPSFFFLDLILNFFSLLLLIGFAIVRPEFDSLAVLIDILNHLLMKALTL